MRRFASYVALLLLLSAAAPVLACVTGVAMTREESACCKSMHGQCGDMVKMGCCRTEVRTETHPQIVAKAPSTDVPLVCMDRLAAFSIAAWTPTRSAVRAPNPYPPPGLLTAQSTVLRI